MTLKKLKKTLLHKSINDNKNRGRKILTFLIDDRGHNILIEDRGHNILIDRGHNILIGDRGHNIFTSVTLLSFCYYFVCQKDNEETEEENLTIEELFRRLEEC